MIIWSNCNVAAQATQNPTRFVFIRERASNRCTHTCTHTPHIVGSKMCEAVVPYFALVLVWCATQFVYGEASLRSHMHVAAGAQTLLLRQPYETIWTVHRHARTHRNTSVSCLTKPQLFPAIRFLFRVSSKVFSASSVWVVTVSLRLCGSFFLYIIFSSCVTNIKRSSARSYKFLKPNAVLIREIHIRIYIHRVYIYFIYFICMWCIHKPNEIIIFCESVSDFSRWQNEQKGSVNKKKKTIKKN